VDLNVAVPQPVIQARAGWTDVGQHLDPVIALDRDQAGHQIGVAAGGQLHGVQGVVEFGWCHGCRVPARDLNRLAMPTPQKPSGLFFPQGAKAEDDRDWQRLSDLGAAVQFSRFCL